MLDDRYYMRRPGSRRISATLILLIASGIIFVVQLAAERWFGFDYLPYLALSVDGLRQGWVWQLFTFQFLHGGWLHLLLNCWAIWVFGRELEETLGVKRYLALYFLSGVAGGLFQMAAGFLSPRWFGAPVVGASAGVFGLIAAFASFYPERPLTMLIFFVIPVSMRAKFLLLFSGAVAALGILFPGDRIAHAAHLGGMILGILFVRVLTHGQWEWPRRERAAPLRLAKVVHSGPASRASRRDPPEDDFLTQQVDPILDKISAHGIQSLTERERQILEAARKRMGR